MRAIPVYRVDLVRKTKTPIGVVFEKRTTDRGGNHFDLLRLARRFFAVDAADDVHITIDAHQLRREIHRELTGDFSPG